MNYVGSAGSTVNVWNDHTNGLIVPRRTVGFRDALDGLSNTLLFSEMLKGDNSQNGVSDTDIVRLGSAPAFADPNFPTQAELDTAGASCDAVSPTGEASWSRCGINWAAPYPYQTLFSAAAPPNWKHRSCAWGARSVAVRIGTAFSSPAAVTPVVFMPPWVMVPSASSRKTST